ncbi:MAG TPA: PQQ-binding-like beta-propeller repeat protein, partial [Pyrinomonadaceae bacterium]
SFDRKIKLWDVATGKELRTLSATGSVFTVVFSADGKLLVSGGGGGTVTLWDAATGKPVRTLAGHKEAVQALALSRDGKLLATGSADETVKLWDVASGRQLRAFSLHTNDPMAGMILAVAFSPDGQTLAAGTLIGAVKSWRVADGKELRAWRAHLFAADTLIFSPDGRTLTTGGGDQTIKQWDVASGTQRRVFTGRSDPVIYLAVSGDGRTMASSRHDEPVKLWRVGSSTDMRTLTGHKGVVISLALDEHGRLLATGGGGTIKLWDVATGKELRTLKAHDSPTQALAMSADGRLLASGSFDPVVKLWDTATGRELHALTGHEGGINNVALSRDGRLLVSSSSDGTIKVWDTEAGRELRSLASPGSDLSTRLALSLDGRTLVVGHLEGDDQLWDVTTGQLRTTLAGQKAPLAFSADSRTFLTGRRNDDNSTVLTLWDAATAREVRSFVSPYRVTAPAFFCADDKLLVTGAGDTRIIIWDAATGRELAALVNVDASDWIAVAPDGLFDGTPTAWSRLLWRFSPKLYDFAPVEAFFSEFYYPDLLADILRGQRPQARAAVAQRDRRQPQVKLAPADEGAEPVVAAPYVNIRVEVAEAGADAAHPTGSGAKDVRLFRNGSLVRVWRGDVLAGRSSVTLTERIPIVAGANHFTAYAFNREDVKSADATLAVTGADRLKRDATLYVVAIGVNKYANPAFNLRYAVADADAFGQELARQQGLIGHYQQTVVVSLLDAEATKANILLAIKRLVEIESQALPTDAPQQLARLKYANPEDGVAIYFAGHGTAQGQRFYLIPHDLGYTGKFNALDAEGLQTLLTHSVSDRELEQAFERLNAGQLLLVLDACNSGQALEAEEKRRGPMNSKGLAQLAYEKGMYILTAAESFQAAQEASQVGHGLLTYALVVEGMQQAAADSEPKDGTVFIREWLDYATNRVPQMQVAQMKAARGLGINLSFKEDERGLDVERRSGQRPRVFYRRELETQPLVIAKPGPP